VKKIEEKYFFEKQSFFFSQEKNMNQKIQKRKISNLTKL